MADLSVLAFTLVVGAIHRHLPKFMKPNSCPRLLLRVQGSGFRVPQTPEARETGRPSWQRTASIQGCSSGSGINVRLAVFHHVLGFGPQS